jgi:hypothetical protein
MRQVTATLREPAGSGPLAASPAAETAWREPTAPRPCPAEARWAPAQTIAVALISSGLLWAGGVWLFHALMR